MNKSRIPLTVLVLFMIACAPSEPVQKNTTKSMGNLPPDICMVGNMPIIYSVSAELYKPVTLSYLRKNGDVVIIRWDSGESEEPTIEYSWTGGMCPTEP